VTDRAVGVTDVSYGVEVVADFRTRERTVGAVTAGEQVLVRQPDRVTSSMAAFVVSNAVLAAANSTTTWRWFLRNPTGSGVTVALRHLEVVAQQMTNAFATIANAMHTLERWTSTGTASGGTQVTAARILSGQTPAVRLYTAAPTGLTNTRGAIAISFFPTVNFTTTAAQNRAMQPTVMEYRWNEPGIELAPGEALAFRQDQAGTTSEATARFMLTNIVVEEFAR
jgi:hypothetical protein